MAPTARRSVLGARRPAASSAVTTSSGFVRQHRVDVVAGGLEQVDGVAGPLGEVPPVHEDLVEDLGRLELAASLGRDHRHDRLVGLVEPPAATSDRSSRPRSKWAVNAAMSLSIRRAWASSTCSPVSACSSRWWWPELDDLGLDPDLVAVPVGDDVELVDVEAEVVEPLDALLDPPHLVGGELLLARSARSTARRTARAASRRCRAPATSWSSESLACRSSSSAKTFSQAIGEVVLAQPVATGST